MGAYVASIVTAALAACMGVWSWLYRRRFARPQRSRGPSFTSLPTINGETLIVTADKPMSLEAVGALRSEWLKAMTGPYPKVILLPVGWDFERVRLPVGTQMVAGDLGMEAE